MSRDLEARIRSIVKRWTPKGWKVKEWDRQFDGAADPVKKTLFVPRLTSRYAACVFMHEVAHVVLGHCDDPSIPDWRSEYEAEKWAYRATRESGLSVPHEYSGDVKHSIRCHCEKALEKDPDCEIDDEVLKFAYPENWREIRDGAPLKRAA